MLPDISDYYNVNDTLLIIFATLMAETILIFLVRYLPSLFSKELNHWYSDFTWTAVLSDISIIVLGFLLTRYIYTTWIKPSYGWNPLLFLGLLVVLQVIHDLLFYAAIILPIPIGHNNVIDLLKKYSLHDGPKIIGGDALLMLMAAFVAFYYKSEPLHVIVTASIFAIYNLTYILHTKSPYESL
jgi:hypothetical protein